jgi:hypothetical protein
LIAGPAVVGKDVDGDSAGSSDSSRRSQRVLGGSVMRGHLTPRRCLGLGLAGVAALVATLAAGACSTFSSEADGNGVDTGLGDTIAIGDSVVAPQEAAADATREDGSSPPTFAVACSAGGAIACTAPSVACCYDRRNRDVDAAIAAYHCVEAGVDCDVAVSPPQSRYECDDPDDCAATGHVGTICCGRIGTNGGAATYYLVGARCESAGGCVVASGGGVPPVQLCIPGSDSCGPGRSCQDITQFSDADGGATYPANPAVHGCR